ncbi:VOC family protein [Altererythrobacter lauratis]|uniref:VOC family protein n=1 Tax=Alteraurantiacibacter lauratis TaxID=2054627 RepID=A0ABV7EK59_9SPHN
MARLIFVNLPVANLPRAIAFYQAIGFVNQPAFTDETAACMAWTDTIFVMLLTHDKWRSFTDRPIAPPTASEVALAINLGSVAAVDHLVATGAANGGVADINPPQDMGFMYQRALADPDGHVWEPFWMDPAAIPPVETNTPTEDTQ